MLDLRQEVGDASPGPGLGAVRSEEFLELFALLWAYGSRALVICVVQPSECVEGLLPEDRAKPCVPGEETDCLSAIFGYPVGYCHPFEERPVEHYCLFAKAERAQPDDGIEGLRRPCS